MNTIFNSIHDHFTANIFADYFEEHDQPKTARELLTSPSGKNTTLAVDNGHGDGECYGDGYGSGSSTGYGDGGFDGNSSGDGDGGAIAGTAIRSEIYQKTFYYLQNSI
jgi:predicted outer membrane repeat protein